MVLSGLLFILAYKLVVYLKTLKCTQVSRNEFCYQ